MGTPLRNLSKILSPNISNLRSPKFLSLQKCSSRKSTVLPLVDAFTICHSEKQLKQKKALPAIEKVRKNLFPEVKIHIEFVGDHQLAKDNENVATNNGLVINTPTKLELLKNGLDQRLDLTILGKGSFGTVFQGQYKGKTMAIKVVQRKHAVKEKNVLNIHHENLVKTFEIIENHSEKYSLVVMEYFDVCRNLQSILEDKNVDNIIDTPLMVSYAMDITSGLSFCHKNRVLHLDLKPKNVLVVNKKQCKICDFGNSINLAMDIENVENWNDFKGTVTHTAPELFLGKAPTEKCDIYSLGIVLWQIQNKLANLYSEITNQQTLIYQVVKGNMRPKVNSQIKNDKFTEIYTKCWAANENQRPKASDILMELNQVIIY